MKVYCIYEKQSSESVCLGKYSNQSRALQILNELKLTSNWPLFIEEEEIDSSEPDDKLLLLECYKASVYTNDYVIDDSNWQEEIIPIYVPKDFKAKVIKKYSEQDDGITYTVISKCKNALAIYRNKIKKELSRTNDLEESYLESALVCNTTTYYKVFTVSINVKYEVELEELVGIYKSKEEANKVVAYINYKEITSNNGNNLAYISEVDVLDEYLDINSLVSSELIYAVQKRFRLNPNNYSLDINKEERTLLYFDTSPEVVINYHKYSFYPFIVTARNKEVLDKYLNDLNAITKTINNRKKYEELLNKLINESKSYSKREYLI